MICLIDLDQENRRGTADFGDRVYQFTVDPYLYGGLHPTSFHVRLFRDGRPAVNPTRGAAVEVAVKRAWVREVGA